MNEAIRDCYIEAGLIASKIRTDALSKIKENIPLLEIAEYVEKRIEDLGAKPAFPCNISINEIASHHTPQDYSTFFRKGDVVKLDIGVHKEGYIVDTAATIELGTGNHTLLIESCEEAMRNAIDSMKDGVKTNQIGKIIEQSLKKHGFNPVKDLTGHNLERFRLHAGITIPNYNSFFGDIIKKDMVFAIEPFATYGRGHVKNGEPLIFSLDKKGKGSTFLQIRNRFCTLPFTQRWIPDISLEDIKGLRKYFQLIESDGEVVAQCEHTVIVNREGCEIIT